MTVFTAIGKILARLGGHTAKWFLYIFNKYKFGGKWSKVNVFGRSLKHRLRGINSRLSNASGPFQRFLGNADNILRLRYFFNEEGIGDFIGNILSTTAKIEIADYVLVDWYNKYLQNASASKVNGALSADASFENLRWLITELVILESFSNGSSEVAEFFTEGISNAMGEIFEKQLVGALSIQTNLRYGSVELDPDSVSEAAESRMVDNRWHAYEILLSGAYNSTAAYTVAKGRMRTLQEMTQVIHQDIFYNVMKSYEGYQATADIFLDEARALYKDKLFDGKDRVEKGLDRWLTQLTNTISYVDSLIDDIGEMSDERWEVTKETTKHSYNRTLAKNISKLNFIYQFYISPAAQQWDSDISTAQNEFNGFLLKHDEMRQEMCNLLVSAEQQIYDRVKGSIDDAIQNVNAARSTGQMPNTNDRFQNNLGG